MSLYEQLIRQSFESQDETIRPEGLTGSVKREAEEGLAQQGIVEINLVSNLDDRITLANLTSSLESAGLTVNIYHTEVFAAESVNSSNGVDTVVRKISPPSGKGGAVAKMDMMEYRTIRVVRPWDVLEEIEKQKELIYIEDEELATHLHGEGYQVAKSVDEALAWASK